LLVAPILILGYDITTSSNQPLVEWIEMTI